MARIGQASGTSALSIYQGMLKFQFNNINTQTAIGLGSGSTANATAMNFCLFGDNGVLRIFESSVEQTPATIAYTTNDVFGIERDGNTVTYWQNGKILRTTSVDPNPAALKVGAFFNTNAAAVINTRYYGAQ